ncbi:cytoplasmic polyadenylation element-binding protein 1 [Anabrus simplex]|uniref:cytoplasmic polyadenylation element-binding protein 1 n=1 Tax=Anabrus simplex TaxID=316456 RepID=UPI0034DD0F58
MLSLQQVGEPCTGPDTDPSAKMLQRINAMLDNGGGGADVLRANSEGDSLSSISDLLGLNLPRGTLLGTTANYGSSINHSSRNYQHCEEDKSPDIQIPMKVLQRNLDSNFHSTPPSPCFPRSFRGSPPYSDCGSPTLEQALMLTCSSGSGGSRSNSPADSDISNGAVSMGSVDGNLSDLMNCLSLNQSQGFLNAEPDLSGLHGLQGMTPLRFLQQQQQQQHAVKANLLSLLHYQPMGDKPWPPISNTSLQSPPPTDSNLLDLAARFHRNAASLYDATCTWSGNLPPRSQKNSGFSCKVFLGGVPWDISEASLIATFKEFGMVRVEWPGKEQAATQPKGYVYIIFESEKQVKALLQSCTQDFRNNGNWYYKISSRKMKSKEVQVIPWLLSDSNYAKSTTQNLDPQKTVFVGALHGMLNAEGLAKIMNDLFDGVVYAGIDTDKYKYPIGSGRVTFNNPRSYMRAVAAAFIEIKTSKFTKKVQVDPYLEDSLCSACGVQQGPYFCRELVCFRYFCHRCWHWQHSLDAMQSHKPLMRNTKSANLMGFGAGRGNGAN